MINAENDMMMRKIVTKILPGLLLFVLLAVDVSAQDDATREARLNVVTDISIFAEQGLAFGTITRGQNKQVNPNDGTVTGSQLTDNVARGLFEVQTSPGQDVNIEIQFPETLELQSVGSGHTSDQLLVIDFAEDEATGTNPAENLFFIPEGAKNLGEVVSATRRNLNAFSRGNNQNKASANSVFLGDFPENELPARDGSFAKNGILIVVGGRVEPTLNQEFGTYTGVITLNATIND